LETHEAPGLSQLAPETEMKPGMVITIEPGIYLPGIGGVRIEDDYVVTERGRRNLSSLPKDLDFATL
jgi:Xaa-Pro aminopeptidase